MVLAELVRAWAEDAASKKQREGERMVRSLQLAEQIRGGRQDRDLKQQKFDLEKEESHLRGTMVRRQIRGSDVATAKDLGEWSDNTINVPDSGTGLGDLVLDPKVRRSLAEAAAAREAALKVKTAGETSKVQTEAELRAKGFDVGTGNTAAALDRFQAQTGRISATRERTPMQGGPGDPNRLVSQTYYDPNLGQNVTETKSYAEWAAMGARPQAASAGRLKEIEDTESSLMAIKRLGTSFAPEYVGADDSLQGMREHVPFIPQNANRSAFRAENAALKSSVIKLITGAQMNQNEEKRILASIPTSDLQPEVWQARHKVLEAAASVAAEMKAGRINPTQGNALVKEILDKAGVPYTGATLTPNHGTTPGASAPPDADDALINKYLEGQ